jgi:cytochrome o ubiquinol oxidase subunit II
MQHRRDAKADQRSGPCSQPGGPRAARSIAIFLAGALITSCQPAGVLDPQGPIASAERLLLINSTEIMLVVVVPVIVATLAFAWWYRASNAHASRDPNWAYQGGVEFVVWSIPALVVILLGGVCWISSHQLDPRAPIRSDAKPLRIDVVSMDWKWLFIYPDQGVAAVNQLVVPAGTPLNFQLTSATVMNAFFVPQLGSQIYTMAGMATHLNLMAERPGSYTGLSTNFSGDGFADMRFITTAVPDDEFDSWVAKTRGSGDELDDARLAALMKPSRAVPPATYRSVDPQLFQRIVDQGARAPGLSGASQARRAPTAETGG